MNILISGISGTIGTAFAEYLLEEGFAVYGVDRDEKNVAALKTKNPELEIKVGDFVDYDFAATKIDVLIHLAAMKHIDLCEDSPNACIINNVIKTQQLFTKARANNVDILFMSTDKAVEPSSVYGYSKALIESLTLEFGGSFARSGNVINSNGSVMGIWDEAIKHQRPLKLTHKDMQRFFISPENLVARIWRQYIEGERVIIPEMDKEVKMIDLAQEKLGYYGYTLESYGPGIEIIGLRPGEKIKEKLQ